MAVGDDYGRRPDRCPLCGENVTTADGASRLAQHLPDCPERDVSGPDDRGRLLDSLGRTGSRPC